MVCVNLKAISANPFGSGSVSPMFETCAPNRGGRVAARKLRRLCGALFLSMLVLAGCSDESVADETGANAGDVSAATTSSTSSTTAVPNRPPEIRVATVGRAEIGQQLTEPILGFDPDGDDVVVTVSDGPLGFSPTLNARGRVTGFEWEPVEPGEWTVEVAGTDPDGATTSTEVLLVARNTRSIDLLLAMGDSIAAGFGRDRSDFLGSDECFRSEEDAYGLQTHGELSEVGALEADGDVLLVACAGATAEALLNTPVDATDPGGAVSDDEERSQVQWAVDLNPTIVTLTVGAADVGIFDPARTAEILTPGPNAELAQATFRENLDTILRQLVTATDAHIALTSYYDPTAAVPNGVDGCAATCFAEAFASAIESLNTTIIDVAGAYPEGRVSLVRLDGEDDVWEAGNATGPDVLRDGLGPLQGLVDQFTGGGGANCASTGGPQRDLISGLDCLHPNAEGHIEIRRLVVEALLSI